MGYVSFDASVKIHQSGRHTSTKNKKTGNGGVSGYLRHIDRGTDRKNGCEVRHANPDIDPERTAENQSYYKDASGTWQGTAARKDMVQAVSRRIAYAKEHGARIYNGGRNDTTILRPLVIQMDSEVIAEHEESWAGDTIAILEEMFGADNIVGYSIHKDETNTHMHVLLVPVAESEGKDGKKKCSVSQTKFFKSPASLSSMHKTIRKKLIEKGYDVELENKPVEEQLAGYTDKDGNWHQQGLTPDQLKELTDKQLALKMEEIKMKMKKEEVDKLEQAMREMQEAARRKKEELETQRAQFEARKAAEETVLSQMQAAVNTDRENVQRAFAYVQEETLKVERAKREAEEMLQKVLLASDACEKILSYDHRLNTKFLEFCEREGKRTKFRTREYVEHLYEKFKKERDETLSGWQKEMLLLREEQKKQGGVPSYGSEMDIIHTEEPAGAYFC